MGGGGGKGHSSVPNKPRQKIVLNKSENIKKKKKKTHWELVWNCIKSIKQMRSKVIFITMLSHLICKPGKSVLLTSSIVMTAMFS